jgi:tetratricopeptide (TPR) repeat protein
MKKPKKKHLHKPVRLQLSITKPAVTLPVGSAQLEIRKAVELGNLSLAVDLGRQIILQVFDEYTAATLLTIFHQMQDWEQQLILADQVIAQSPRFVAGHVARAFALYSMQRFQEALISAKQVVCLEKNNSEHYSNLGLIYKSLGDIANASESFNHAIALKSDNYKAYIYRSDLGVDISADEIIKMEAVLKVAPHKEKPNLYFPLARIRENLGDYEGAFDFWVKGNSIYREKFDFNIDEFEKEHDVIRGLFSEDFIAAHTLAEASDYAPVFIVGFPRCGSTLVEQIVSSHSLVTAGAEQSWMPNAINSAISLCHSERLFPLCMADFNAKHWHQVARAYQKSMQDHAGENVLCTDKTLINYKFIGVIHLIFPQAIIINVNRDPRDTILGCFRQLFVSDNLQYLYDLKETVRAYKTYRLLMEHWHKVLPGRVLDVDYEKLVENPDSEIKSLINHCGLSWEEECLAFYKNKRGVVSASNVQVRKPLFKDNIARWRNYEPYLGDVFSGL